MIKIEPINEIFSKIDTDYSISKDIRGLFRVRDPQFMYSFKYKAGAWDGYWNLINGEYVYNGLVPFILKYAELKGIDVCDNTRVMSENGADDVDEFIESLGLKLKPYDYQLCAIKYIIKKRKELIISPTSSGKSFIIYILCRYMMEHKGKKDKLLIVVPSKILVNQMYNDFKSYSVDWDVEENVKKISSDYEKDFSKNIIITTYHSVFKYSLEFFKQFYGVIVDEAHGCAGQGDKPKSIQTLLDKTINSIYRVGLTGTFPEERLYQLTMMKYFVNKDTITTYDELLDENKIAPFEVNSVIFQHNVEKCGMKYRDEIKYIQNNNKRADWVEDKLLEDNKNSLLLFVEISNHAEKIYQLLKMDPRFSKYSVFLLTGDPKEKKEKEKIKELLETHDNIIILATYKLLGTGWSVNNLYNIFFMHPLKKKQPVLQAVGRGLRLHPGKFCHIYDLIDKFSYSNILWNQYRDRLKHYVNAKIEVKEEKVNLDG